MDLKETRKLSGFVIFFHIKKTEHLKQLKDYYLFNGCSDPN